MVMRSRIPGDDNAPALRLRVRRLSWIAAVMLGVFLLWLGIEITQLLRIQRINTAIARGDLTALAEQDSPRGQLSRALLAQRDGHIDQAISAYAGVNTAAMDRALREVVRFNLANLYLARAVEHERDDEQQLRISLIEQAKENYRDLLSANPSHWDARYNLSRALQMLPDLDDLQFGDEVNPERSPQAPSADTAYERLP